MKLSSKFNMEYMLWYFIVNNVLNMQVGCSTTRPDMFLQFVTVTYAIITWLISSFDISLSRVYLRLHNFDLNHR